jgi:NitT/TauT family transport system substrate-binding protein
MTRPAFRFLAATLVLALTMIATTTAWADPFRIIVPEPETPLVPNSVIDLALRLGYYKREGVDVELVRVKATPSAVAALRSGQGDMANIGTDIALQLIARGQMDLKAVISPEKSLPLLIAAKKSVTAPKQLEGMVFGVSQIGSVDYVQSRLVLTKLGVDNEKLRYLAVGQPTVRAQALLAGQIDATAMSIGTWLTLPSKDGLAVLVDQPAYHAAAPLVTKINVVTAATAKDRRREVGAVVRAIVAASRDFARDPKLWVDGMVAARPDVKREQLEQLAEAYRGSWSVDGGLNPSEIALTTDALYQTEDFKDIPRRVAPSDWIDHSFIDQVPVAKP